MKSKTISQKKKSILKKWRKGNDDFFITGKKLHQEYWH
jgi:hypothetical protein